MLLPAIEGACTTRSMPHDLMAVNALEEMRARRLQEEAKGSPQEPSVATPLRSRKRESSPVPTPQRSSLAPTPSSPRGSAQAQAAPAAPVPAAKVRSFSPWIGALVFLVLAVLGPELVRRSKAKTGKAHRSKAAEPLRATTVPEDPEAFAVPPKLLQRVQEALACPGPRADVLDILAGAPYEFLSDELLRDSQAYKLPRLAATAGAAARAWHGPVPAGPDHERLVEVVHSLVATGGGWPERLRQRLQDALAQPCEAAAACAAPRSRSVPLEVDERFTSPGARTESNWLHQALTTASLATGLKPLVDRAKQYQSKPPSVVLSQEPLTNRDCLALRVDSSPTLAFRLEGSHSLSALTIEQPERWAAEKPRSQPRRFTVAGIQQSRSAGVSQEVKVLLGSFEYAVAGPAAQVFQLKQVGRVSGLRLEFEGSWGENYLCLYRIQAFEGPGPFCASQRVAAIIAK